MAQYTAYAPGIIEYIAANKKPTLGGTERFHISGTYFYISKVAVRVYEDGWGIGIQVPVNEWRVFRYTGGKYRCCGSISDVLEKSYCPNEILFNMDVFSKFG